MTILLGATVFLLYLAAASLLALRLASVGLSQTVVRTGAAGATLVAVALHGLLLYDGIVTTAGLNLGFFNAASLVAWAIVLLLLAAAASKPVDNLGILVLPFAALTVLLAMLYPSEHLLARQAGTGIRIHVVVSIVAYSVLAIAACQSMLLYVQEYLLRHKRPGRLVRILPPLQTQESLLVQLLAAGFFLLSLSLLSGVMFLQNLFAQHLVHKTVLSLVAWMVFALLLWGRWRHGWRGRTLIRFSLGGFVMLMLAYFGSKLVLEVVLGRGWSGT